MFDVNFIDAQHQVDLRRLISRWPGIRIDAALDLCDPLLMLENQHRYGDCSTNEDRHNRHQQSTKTYDRIEQPHSRLRKATTVGPRPTTVFLVELTGIEPVASWLQTRRSPS